MWLFVHALSFSWQHPGAVHCPAVPAPLADVPAGVRVAWVHDSAPMRMSLFSLARDQAEQRQADVMAVSCVDASAVALAFAEYPAGADCLTSHMHTAMASVDALDERDAATIKLEAVLRQVPGWRRARACSVPSSAALAGAFWTLVSVCVVYWRRQQRQTPDEDPTRTRTRAKPRECPSRPGQTGPLGPAAIVTTPAAP